MAPFYLHNHVVAKGAIQRHELAVRLLGAVVRLLMRVDERAPHHHPAMRRQCIGEQVRAIGVAASIVLRAGLAFGVGLDQKPAKIRNARIDGVGCVAPPALHLRVQRVGSLQTTDFDGGTEARTEKHANAIGAKNRRQCCGLIQIVRCQAPCLGIDVVEHGSIDAQRRVGTRAVGVARIQIAGQRLPIPQRRAGIATFHQPIEIVPMIKHAQLQAWRCTHVQGCKRLPGLKQTQQVECAVQHTDIAAADNGGNAMPIHIGTTDEIALAAQLACVELQGRDLRCAGGTQHNRAIARYRVHVGRRVSQ